MSTKMNPEVKTAWLAALRSGEYAQTKQRLRREGPDGGFCCLGVLTDLFIEAGASDGPGWEMSPSQYGVYRFCHTCVSLSDPVRQWADMEYDIRSDENIVYTLANMNDSGSTFAQIADYIEENL